MRVVAEHQRNRIRGDVQRVRYGHGKIGGDNGFFSGTALNDSLNCDTDGNRNSEAVGRDLTPKAE